MSSHWISAPMIFDGFDMHEGMALEITNDRVSAIRPCNQIDPNRIDRHFKTILSPGFFDIQINGGGGTLFNNDPSLTGIATIKKAHRRFGTTSFLPTLITDHINRLSPALSACVNAYKNGVVSGIHIEGPHISTQKRGTHQAEFVRPMDDDTLSLVKDARAQDLPILMTIAPEAVTLQQVAQLINNGVCLSIGHSNASYETVQRYLDAGVHCFTHLFNAMSQMESRAAGVTGAAILSDRYCSIIADGIHVAPQMIKLAVDGRPIKDRMILVSDAMPTIGGPGHFVLYDQEIRLNQGRLINQEGALAGAHLTMAQAVQNLKSDGFSNVQILRMARHNPARMLGLWDDMQLIGLPIGELIQLSHDLAFAGFAYE